MDISAKQFTIQLNSYLDLDISRILITELAVNYIRLSGKSFFINHRQVETTVTENSSKSIIRQFLVFIDLNEQYIIENPNQQQVDLYQKTISNQYSIFILQRNILVQINR